MHVPYRNFLIVSFFCFGFLVLATYVKVSEVTTSSPVPAWQRPVEAPVAIVRPPVTYPSPHAVMGAATTSTGANIPAVSAAVDAYESSRPGISGVTAHAYIVGDVETGHIYLEHNSSRVLPVASMSKLVTAFVATNTFSMDTVITISSSSAAVPPDKSNLKVGEMFTVKELLQPLLLSSSNVAAEALASSLNRIDFLELMSGYSWEIGMPSSYFADPSGVSPRNVASARDLFSLAKYLYASRPDILTLTRTTGTQVGTTTEHGSHIFASTHPFASDLRFIGGKTGRTPEAGDTMLTILKIDGQPIAIVVLGSRYDGRAGDTKLLADKVEEMIK